MASSAESTIAARNVEEAPGPANEPRSVIRLPPGACVTRIRRPSLASKRGPAFTAESTGGGQLPRTAPVRTGPGLPAFEAPNGRNDLAAVDLQLGLLVAVHQIDVELRHPGRGEVTQLLDVVRDLAEDAEPVGHLILDERG